MVEILTFVYLTYSFIALYFLILFFMIYVPNMKNFYYYPKSKKDYSLSIIVPCYNEEENIGGTIQSLLDSDYKNLKKIIVVDDRSTDNSYNIIKKYAENYSKVLAVQTPENTGKASGSKNYGVKFVDTELIGFSDADSYPQKDSIKKMIGFFDDEKVAAVTPQILVKNRGNFIENLQAIEYKLIVFTRKLLGFVDAIYVTPGPLAIYRKKIFDEVGGFDETNLTEDIELTWNLLDKKYKIEMCIPSLVYTVAPNKFKDWFKQRIRWNLGGIQTIDKYKFTFFKKGILGNFVLPFFILSWVIGIFGLFVLGYRLTRRFIMQWLTTTYSIQSQTAILTFRDLNLTPNVLVFFGVGIFILSLCFMGISILHLREIKFKKHGFFNIVGFMFIYLLAYPFLLVGSIYKYLRGIKTW